MTRLINFSISYYELDLPPIILYVAMDQIILHVYSEDSLPNSPQKHKLWAVGLDSQAKRCGKIEMSVKRGEKRGKEAKRWGKRQT